MPENVYFILQHRDACPFAQKLAKYKIQKDPMGIDGNVIEGRVRYWAGVLAEKCAGVYVYAASGSVLAAPQISMSGAVATVTATGAEISYTVDGTDPRYSAGALALTSGGTVTLKGRRGAQVLRTRGGEVTLGRGGAGLFGLSAGEGRGERPGRTLWREV